MFHIKSQHFFNRYQKFIRYCQNSNKNQYTENTEPIGWYRGRIKVIS